MIEAREAAQSAKKILDYYLGEVPYNDDKILVIDLCRLLANSESFYSELVDSVGHITLPTYRVLTQFAIQIQSQLQATAKEWYHHIDFQTWRQDHFKDYLKVKRKEEREKKQYAKPYTEYLERIEKEMFKDFWTLQRWHLTTAFILGTAEGSSPYIERVLALRDTNIHLKNLAEKIKYALEDFDPSEQFSLFKTMRSFEDLNRPLCRRYRSLRNTKGIQLEKHLAGAFYPLTGFGYGRSQAFPSGYSSRICF